MVNKDLNKAKKAKNDEFYTQFSDIQKEIDAYVEHNPDLFRGKTILCPCDDYEASNFQKYFALNFKNFGLKKLICTGFAYSEQTYNEESEENKGKGKLYVLTADGDTISVIESYLEGDGDFRSEEIKALRDEADFIITNPPFSLFREFVDWITEADKSFLILGNINAVTYKEIFPLIMKNKLWMGFSIHSGDREFRVPESYPLDAAGFRTDEKGNKYIRVKGVRWFTNIDHGRHPKELSLMTMEENLKNSKHKSLREQGYLRYDNYDAIEVPYTDAIPSDYEPCWFKCTKAKDCTFAQSEAKSDDILCENKRSGVMGVPITFLDKFCSEQFRIVGEANSGSNNAFDLFKPTINKQHIFKRILIQKVQ